LLINIINNKHLVEFDYGKFDKWCVYLKRENVIRYAPVDQEYFSFFKNMGQKYGSDIIYKDFLSIYERTSPQLETQVIALIKKTVTKFNEDAEEMEVWFSVIYGGMIAEENKANMILKKRIKRLGMHQILIENHSPADAAKFSFGKKWRELNILMKERGFGI
jgi:hypothetical protein